MDNFHAGWDASSSSLIATFSFTQKNLVDVVEMELKF
jgi:hypothetical protein